MHLFYNHSLQQSSRRNMSLKALLSSMLTRLVNIASAYGQTRNRGSEGSNWYVCSFVWSMSLSSIYSECILTYLSVITRSIIRKWQQRKNSRNCSSVFGNWSTRWNRLLRTKTTNGYVLSAYTSFPFLLQLVLLNRMREYYMICIFCVHYLNLTRTFLIQLGHVVRTVIDFRWRLVVVWRIVSVSCNLECFLTLPHGNTSNFDTTRFSVSQSTIYI